MTLNQGKILEEVQYCANASISTIKNSIHRVILSFEHPQDFLAGQYLKLWLNGYQNRSFSIASRLQSLNSIELFIGCSQNDSVSSQIIDFILKNKKITVSLPYGKAYYRLNSINDNIYIIVSDTGYSYGKSILLEAINDPKNKNIFLIWIVSNIKTNFDPEFLSYCNKHSNFKYFCINDAELLLPYLLNTQNNLVTSDIYFATNRRIYSLLQTLFHQLKIPLDCIYSDSIDN